MSKNINKLVLIFFILIILLFYYLIFYGVTYKFKSEMELIPNNTNNVMTFNKTFNKTDIESIDIISDASYIILEQSNKDFIEISSKYNSQSLFYVKLKNKKLTIKQYANSAQEKDNTKFLSIKLPEKKFNKLNISCPILTVQLSNCYFDYINIKSKISTINLDLPKSPKKTKLYIDTGSISLNVPPFDNKFKILTSRSELTFFGEKYIGFIQQKKGTGSNFFDIYCGFGIILIDNYNGS